MADQLNDIISRARQVPGFNELPDADKTDLVMKMLEKAAETGTTAIVATPDSSQLAQPQPTPTTAAPRNPSEFELETTPTAESQVLTAGPGGRQWGDPGTSVSDLLSRDRNRQMADQQRAQDAQSQQANVEGLKVSALPAAGSILGTALAGPAGDIVGTTAGYGANLALGWEKPSLMGALTQLGPSYLLNAWPALKQTLGGFAGTTTAGKTALATEARQGFEATEAGKVAQNTRDRAAMEQHNLNLGTVNKNLQAGFEAGEQAKVEGQNQLITNVEQSNAATQTAKGAADNYVDSANATLTAQFEAAKAADEAQQAVQQRVFKQQMDQHQALLDFQKAEKEKYAQQMRTFVNAVRQGDHQRATQLLANLPGVPTEDAIKQAYGEVWSLAKANNVTFDLPEVGQLRKTFLDEATRIRKIVGNSPLADRLEAMGNAGQGAIDLVDLYEGKKLMRNHMASLQQSTSEYAAGERRLYGRLLDALDADLTAMSTQHPEIATWKDTVQQANALNLKHETVNELTGFVTSNLFDVNPANGEAMFNAGKFLRAIEQPSHAQLKSYMQKTTFDELGGKSLYDVTKENFKEYVQDVYGGTEQLRQLRKTGGVEIPPAPTAPAVNPQMGPEPAGMATIPAGQTLDVPSPYKAQPYQPVGQPAPVPPVYQSKNYQMPNTDPSLTGVLGNAALRAGSAVALGTMVYPYLTQGGTPPIGQAAIMAGLGAGASGVVARAMMTPEGQRLLLTLMRESGPRLTPASLGLLSAALRYPGAVNAPQAGSNGP